MMTVAARRSPYDDYGDDDDGDDGVGKFFPLLSNNGQRSLGVGARPLQFKRGRCARCLFGRDKKEPVALREKSTTGSRNETNPHDLYHDHDLGRGYGPTTTTTTTTTTIMLRLQQHGERSPAPWARKALRCVALNQCATARRRAEWVDVGIRRAAFPSPFSFPRNGHWTFGATKYPVTRYSPVDNIIDNTAAALMYEMQRERTM
ncbi:uncharacterized protein IWZ02DRAFT_481977 [Phyllosticta citriasiana]|uniref:uncharacterized protein n=1 Tax=Phyllosticta citriasiana TaxID=595635 RepID=UPI0030FDA8A5